MHAHYNTYTTVNVVCPLMHATTAWRNAKKWVWQGRLHLEYSQLSKILFEKNCL